MQCCVNEWPAQLRLKPSVPWGGRRAACRSGKFFSRPPPSLWLTQLGYPPSPSLKIFDTKFFLRRRSPLPLGCSTCPHKQPQAFRQLSQPSAYSRHTSVPRHSSLTGFQNKPLRFWMVMDFVVSQMRVLQPVQIRVDVQSGGRGGRGGPVFNRL
jgi:hypothetical protein